MFSNPAMISSTLRALVWHSASKYVVAITLLAAFDLGQRG